MEREEEPRPWEQPGAVRRDCAPHRAELLSALGNTALVCSVLSPCGGAPALLSLPLAISVWALARGDLARMGAGAMDSTGRRRTAAAKALACTGVVLSLPGLIVLLIVLLLLTVH